MWGVFTLKTKRLLVNKVSPFVRSAKADKFLPTAKGVPVPAVRNAVKTGKFFLGKKMNDSLMIAALEQTTASVNMLSGVLLIFMGAFIATICGYLAIRYTLRG